MIHLVAYSQIDIVDHPRAPGLPNPHEVISRHGYGPRLGEQIAMEDVNSVADAMTKAMTKPAFL